MELVLEDFRCFLLVIWEQSCLSFSSGQCYPSTLTSGEARHTAPVVRFAAGSTLAVCRSSLPIMPLPVPPSASLAAPHNRMERDS